MMEKFSLFSEGQIREWYLDLKKMYQQIHIVELPFDQDHILPEERVAAVLGVSKRTMRAYRARKRLSFLKLEGQVYYIKVLLYTELILLCLDSRVDKDSL